MIRTPEDIRTQPWDLTLLALPTAIEPVFEPCEGRVLNRKAKGA